MSVSVPKLLILMTVDKKIFFDPYTALFITVEKKLIEKSEIN